MNAIKMMTQAVLVDDEQLKAFSADFLSKHKIVDFKEWKGISLEVAKSLLEEIIKQKSK